MARSASPYTRITSSSGDSPKWAAMPVPFWINERGLSQITNRSEFEAVLASFRTWEAAPGADVRFDYRGMTSVRSVAHDGINIVSFADDSTPIGSSTIAVTFSYFKTQNNTLLFDEADIIFNPTLNFSTSGETEKFDIQSVLTHEVGHLLGLDHSGLVSSVMVPFSQPSQVHQRTLSYDDVAGISEIYPRAAANPSVGQIQGFIRNGATGVFGAHVVAVDQAGTAWVSTLSQPTGSYTLRFLPPGAYRVMAEPLDLPVTEQNVGGGSNSWYRNLRTDFATTYYGNAGSLSSARTVQVTAGTAPVPADIQVLPKGTTGLNLTRPAFAARIPIGASGTFRVGGEDITAGTLFSTSSADVTLGGPVYAGRISSVASTSADIPLSVSSSAALGPKLVTVNRGTDSSVVPGAFVVVDRVPTPQQIVPASGSNEGGTAVQITGANFRPGAKVYFGGLAAANVNWTSSASIGATAPQNSPGPVNVQVINSDGTNGVLSGGFTYILPTATLTGVSPASGPPATAVTISGTHFDSRAQNVEVRFNGALARVSSATPAQIVAVVPYGATSGPVAVSVFGVSAVGDVNFTVTAGAASTNRALNTYNFIDSIGSSSLTFQGSNANDDAVTSVQLPFTFSLFNDIYLPGSSISVSTNGWISMESGADPNGYQNGSLPGTSAPDASGTARTIPPSLIAPFFDDLALVPGTSSVTTKVVGAAPNRQLALQWNKMTILNEDGNDLHATLTFEAILFEGSNDIQFVYQSMSGSRSNGSSATIGLQNLARNRAVQTGFNEAKVGTGSFLTYRFNEGAYTVTESDSTPPTKPVVTDGGATTNSRAELSASWMSQDNESGIREYQYSIGKTPGGADVLAWVQTAQNSVTVTGLSLQAGSTYYFAVKAINNAGLASEIGVSDGIRVDPAFQPDVKIVPSAPHNASEFSGIALYAPSAMTAVLKAIDANGAVLAGQGIQNPVTVTLSAGQQYARLVQEWFGLSSFDGWIEIEASATGLGVYTATGSWDMLKMDGSAARDTSSNFVVFHPGATVILVNPSTRTATVTIGELGGASRTIAIPPRARVSAEIAAVSRIQSSEAIACLERFGSGSKLGVGTPVPVNGAQASLVIPNGVTGQGYVTILTVANVLSMAVDTTLSFGGVSKQLRLEANSAQRISLADFLQIPSTAIRTDAVRLSAASMVFGAQPALVGVVDIESVDEIVSLGARPASVDFLFAHVAHGNGLFTGLAIASGNAPATITLDIYPASGQSPKSVTFTMQPNQQLAKLVSEFVPTLTVQLGGYIRIRSDQPIWAWEVYGSGRIMASGPPI